jgi:hypothetical protein
MDNYVGCHLSLDDRCLDLAMTMPKSPRQMLHDPHGDRTPLSTLPPYPIQSGASLHQHPSRETSDEKTKVGKDLVRILASNKSPRAVVVVVVLESRNLRPDPQAFRNDECQL